MVITNGGLFSSTSAGFTFRTGASNSLLIGSSTGSKSIFNGNGNSSSSLGNSSQSMTNTLVQVDTNGVITNIGSFSIGQSINGAPAFSNSVVIRNGGAFYVNASATIYIGRGTNANTNSLITTGPGLLLDVGGGTSIFVGFASNNATMGNNLRILNGGVLTNSGIITVDNTNSYVTISGGISYATGVLLNNATTSLTISNNGSTNGTIIARGSGNLISGSGAVTLAGNAGMDAAAFGVTNTANMTGAGALTVNGNGGTGTLTLSGSNSYTGGTLVSGGTLQIATNQTIASSTAITNNATLLLGSTSTTLQNAYTVNGGQTLTLTGNGTTVFSTTNNGQIFNVLDNASLVITNTTLINTNALFGLTFGTGAGTITMGSSTMVAAGNNGFAIGANETFIVGTGGVFTNSYIKIFNSNQTLILTNGGTFSSLTGSQALYLGWTGSTNNRLLIGSSLGNQTSTFNVGAQGINLVVFSVVPAVPTT